MQNNKIKISQKEFDDVYQIDEITEETPVVPKEDITPPLLSEEEKQQEDAYLEGYNTEQD